jgi:predicted GNAT family acetyltransferase
MHRRDIFSYGVPDCRKLNQYFLEKFARTLVIIRIVWLIALLSFRLRECDLYQGLFYHSIGLFIYRDILGVTGMAISENGTEGKGAHSVIHVSPEAYRVEGTSEDAPPRTLPESEATGLRGSRDTTGIIVKELCAVEFPVAETLWTEYHETKGDMKTDRIFVGFAQNEPVSVARCRKHPDGFEVDAVFTPPTQRGHGYAHALMRGLVKACRNDVLLYARINKSHGILPSFWICHYIRK